MAQPKALQSQYGQGPGKLQKTKEAAAGAEEQVDLSDFIQPFKQQEGDDIIAPETAIPGTARGLPEEQPKEQVPSAFERFWTLPRAGQPQPTVEQSMQELKGMGAELAGGTTASAVGAGVGAGLGGLGGLILGGPFGAVPGAQAGAAVGAFAGSVLTKDAVNFFRETFGLEKEEDRNQLIDVALSAVPFAGTRALKVPFQALKRSPEFVERTVAKALTKEESNVFSAIRSGLVEKAGEVGGEKFAANLERETTEDILSGLNAGLSPIESIREASKKAASKLDASRKFDELANFYGEPVSQAELVALGKGQASLRTSPGEVLDSLRSNYTQEWNLLIEKGIKDPKLLDKIDKIDLEPILQNLNAIKEDAGYAKKFGSQIDDIIENIQNQKAIEKSQVYKNISPEEASKLAVKDVNTGKEVSLNDLLSPGKRFETKQVQTQIQGPGTEFGAVQIQESFPMNQRLAEQKMITLDKLIRLRQSLDKSPLAAGALTEEKQALQAAVKQLRNAEDGALQAMRESSDPVVSGIGKKAIESKGKIASLLGEIETLGNVSKQDVISFAGILDGKEPAAVGALRNSLKDYPETRSAIATTYFNKRLSKLMENVGTEVGIKESMSDKMANFILGAEKGTNQDAVKFFTNLDLLSDDLVSGTEAKRKLMSLANSLDKASRIPSIPVRNSSVGKLVAKASASLAEGGLSINPMTWIGAAPNNPELAKSIVTEIFKTNADDAAKAMITTPAEVALSVSQLDTLLGARAKPIIDLTLKYAKEAGMDTTKLAPIRYQFTPGPEQEGIQ